MVIKKRISFPNEEEIKKLAAEAKIDIKQATILYNRGIDTLEKVDAFLDMNEHNLHNPLLMTDAEVAAKQILKSIDNKEKIVLYSDYDADGWGAAVVGYEMLTRLGANVSVYTNVRSQGYGMCVSGVDEILESYPDTKLILTADNGIVAYAGIDYAVEKGIKVVVTDHHQPAKDGKMPAAVANVNPHRDGDKYPCKYLCGAGVLWKVLSICYYMKGIPSKEANKELDVIALATVADVVPILDENRVLVAKGLKMISDEVRPQWSAFKKSFGGGFQITEVDTKTIGFSFGPGINAMSRMKGTIKLPINLFTMNISEPDMYVLTDEMTRVNEERKAVTQSCEEAAVAIVENLCLYNRKVIVIYSDEMFEGVVGLVAGRIREVYNRPTIVLTPDENGNYRGSGRSVNNFHIKEVLDEINAEHPGMLLGYGGHALACGLTVAAKSLDDFIMALTAKADALLPDENVIDVRADFAYDDSTKGEINGDLLAAIKNLGPYGKDFEEPNIVIRNCTPVSVRLMGAQNQHISIDFGNFQLTSWNSHLFIPKNLNGTPNLNIKKVSAIGTLEKDDFGFKLMVDKTNFEFITD